MTSPPSKILNPSLAAAALRRRDATICSRPYPCTATGVAGAQRQSARALLTGHAILPEKCPVQAVRDVSHCSTSSSCGYGVLTFDRHRACLVAPRSYSEVPFHSWNTPPLRHPYSMTGPTRRSPRDIRLEIEAWIVPLDCTPWIFSRIVASSDLALQLGQRVRPTLERCDGLARSNRPTRDRGTRGFGRRRRRAVACIR